MRPCIVIFTINVGGGSMDDWIKWIQFRIIPCPCTIILEQRTPELDRTKPLEYNTFNISFLFSFLPLNLEFNRSEQNNILILWVQISQEFSLFKNI